MNFRIKNVIESGLLNKWKKVDQNEQLRNVAIVDRHKSNDKLTLNHTSVVFYSLLFCLPISIAVLFIGIIFFIKTNIR